MGDKKTPAKKKAAVGEGLSLTVDSNLIRRLADLMAETGLTEIELGDGDQRLRVARGGGVTVAPAAAQPAPAADSPVMVAATASDGAPPAGAVPSPMVGTVFTAPEPGSAPFVSVGDEIEKDDILFVIEAMKVMNPIRAPRAGKVLELMVKNGDPVEFGETLLVLG